MTKNAVKTEFVDIFCRILQSPVEKPLLYTDLHPIKEFQ